MSNQVVSSPKKVDVDTLVQMKVHDAKVGQTVGKLTLVEKISCNSPAKKSFNRKNKLASTVSRQRASLRA